MRVNWSGIRDGGFEPGLMYRTGRIGLASNLTEIREI
jgi:hypothetical protein